MQQGAPRQRKPREPVEHWIDPVYGIVGFIVAAIAVFVGIVVYLNQGLYQ
jgi:hypothetical protein